MELCASSTNPTISAKFTCQRFKKLEILIGRHFWRFEDTPKMRALQQCGPMLTSFALLHMPQDSPVIPLEVFIKAVGIVSMMATTSLAQLALYLSHSTSLCSHDAVLVVRPCVYAENRPA